MYSGQSGRAGNSDNSKGPYRRWDILSLCFAGKGALMGVCSDPSMLSYDALICGMSQLNINW